MVQVCGKGRQPRKGPRSARWQEPKNEMWQGRTDGEGDFAVVAAKFTGAQRDELGAKHDALLRQQRYGAEGAREVQMVYVRRSAVLLCAHTNTGGAQCQLADVLRYV